jgi:hypothetical protein
VSPRDDPALSAWYATGREGVPTRASASAGDHEAPAERAGTVVPDIATHDAGGTCANQRTARTGSSMHEERRDALMSRQVETGLIFREMLGIDDALAYWRAAAIPESVIERLVNGHPGRVARSSGATTIAAAKPADARVSLFYHSSGRRRDLIGAAVVQAAIAIQQELGRDRAACMLRRDGLPDDVVERVLASYVPEGPKVLRQP